jgi:hypothetical protein
MMLFLELVLVFHVHKWLPVKNIFCFILITSSQKELKSTIAFFHCFLAFECNQIECLPQVPAFTFSNFTTTD